MKRILIVLLIMSLFVFGCAKKEPTEVVTEDNTSSTPVVVVEEEPSQPQVQEPAITVEDITSVVKEDTVEETTEEPQTVYRVQIFASYYEEKANKVADEARKKLPDVPVYVVHIEPYYKVRVGNCKTPEEAMKLLERCREVGYEDAWKVEDVYIPGEDE